MDLKGGSLTTMMILMNWITIYICNIEQRVINKMTYK